ncbi:MAG: hypothetical protein FD187_1505 [bacterium]|nr:MAG: hypothetical protein FD142_258 [bacterium]KAF0148957.1 MAG: hypothetical protein FD187_1505 [bacterium]KAF0168348.1 MAG: hypothetical protein FD158_1429 [bacterium]TXT22662.1 MAG: hypothetical protein FD132_349 [bacterium]
MNQTDLLINLLGCTYGVVLIAAMFLRTPLTEAMRIDALFIPRYSEKTRPLNLLAGLLIAGYALHSLLTPHP